MYSSAAVWRDQDNIVYVSLNAAIPNSNKTEYSTRSNMVSNTVRINKYRSIYL